MKASNRLLTFSAGLRQEWFSGGAVAVTMREWVIVARVLSRSKPANGRERLWTVLPRMHISMRLYTKGVRFSEMAGRSSSPRRRSRPALVLHRF